MKYFQARDSGRGRHSWLPLTYLLAATAVIIFNVAGAIRPETFWVVPLRQIPEDIFSSEQWAEPNYVAQGFYLSHLFDEALIIPTQIDPRVKSDLQFDSRITVAESPGLDMPPLNASSLDNFLSQAVSIFPDGSETGCSFFSSETQTWVRKKSRCAVSVWIDPDSLKQGTAQLIQFSDGDEVWLIDKGLFERARP